MRAHLQGKDVILEADSEKTDPSSREGSKKANIDKEESSSSTEQADTENKKVLASSSYRTILAPLI